MKKYLLYLIAFFSFSVAYAQNGLGDGAGTYLNYNDYINYERSAGGDVEIDVAGYMEIGPLGLYDIYGALINSGTIEIQNGGVLNIYGDVINNAQIIVRPGGKLNFYGKNWKNAPIATVNDGDFFPNTTPGGDVFFNGNRPAVPASWVTLSPFLVDFSGGSFIQYADGGNIPMDVALHLNNAENVSLINTPLRIEGKLQWNVADGNIVLGNQDLIFTTNATQAGFREDRFAITNGTGHVVKENYTGNWIFPVGITQGDYTPAAINNTSTNTMHVLVQDYSTSTSDEGLVASSSNGIDRTWNIYAATDTGNSEIILQHNSITNQPAFNNDYNFVTRWSNDTPNTTGDTIISYSMSAWQSNKAAPSSLGNLSSLGVVMGAVARSRTYTTFALAPTSPEAYYTKSSDIINPLTINVITLTATPQECDVVLNFKSGLENSISKYQLQHSTDGLRFTAIAEIEPKGNYQDYNYTHIAPPSGKNIYRLMMIEPTGDYSLTQIALADVDCSVPKPVFVLYPNPATNYVTIAGMTGPSQIRITNILGREMIATTSVANSETIDISALPAAPYVVSVIQQGKVVAAIKLIKL